MRLLPVRRWLRARLSRAPGRELVHAAGWTALIGSLEVLGRRSETDAHDALGVTCLVSAGAVTWFEHRRAPLAIVTALGERLREGTRSLARLRWKTGLDLRGEPALPRGLPLGLRLALLFSVASCAGLALVREDLPEGLRVVALRVSPTLWFAFLALLWGTLIAGTLVLALLPAVHAHDRLSSWRTWRRRPSWISELTLLMAYATGLAIAAVTFPGATPLWIAAIATIVPLALLSLPGQPRRALSWRAANAEAGAALHVTDWTRALQVSGAAGVGALFSIVLIARGSQLSNLEPSSAPVTTTLGWIFSWAFAVGALVEAKTTMTALFAARFRDPARPVRTRVAWAEAEGGETLEAWRKLEANGWSVVEPERTRSRLDARCIVPLREDANATRDDWRWAARWPIAIAASDLTHPEFIERVTRRDEILRRRHLLRGLGRMFNEARSRNFARGQGFWVCPHLWGIWGLHRDVDEDLTWSVGSSFARAIPLASRAHLHCVLRGLQVDLVFVEDGVTFRRLRRVFTMMFELHDVFGGRKRAEDPHFQGLPGVRVLIHELTPGSPFRSTRYPEPDYDDIGRARILHVFRDRGLGEEPVSAPRVSDFVPDRTPVLV
mgnify:CR=1 FL=1